jgi:methionyl-tRNA formyltransferase
MDDRRKLKVVLFALTGFGNTVLSALLKDERVEVRAVYTVRYEQPFPYYEERQLIEECAEKGIVCHHGVKVNGEDGMSLLRAYSPDLIMVATFKQIIREEVLSLPSLGVVNFHPSLLPKYRGPCPTNAALLNDDGVAGVSVHYVTAQVDEGNILLQRSIPISETDNDGCLRQKLAILAGEMVPDVIGMFADFMKPTGFPQDHALASLAPKPVVEDGYLERATDIWTIRNKVRALSPLPGTSLFLGDRRIPVDGFEIIHAVDPDGIYDRGDDIDVILNSEAIKLFKKS